MIAPTPTPESSTKLDEVKPGVAPAADREKFEAMLGRLEGIVTKMESSDLPLEQLLTQYEEGMKLVKECGSRLEEAEQIVEVLSRPTR